MKTIKQFALFALLAMAAQAQYTPPSGGGGGGSGTVTSVFGRTPVVVAAPGDYTAAQVTNAVDTTQTYSNPGWITALAAAKITGLNACGTLTAGASSTYIRGDCTVQTLNAAAVAGLAASATTDTTNATNISSGTLNAARLPSTFSIAGPITLTGGAGVIDYPCITTPAAPSSGQVTPFCNSANSNHWSIENSAGTVTDLQAGSSGGLTLIQEQVLGGAAASVTFSSIPGTFRNLRLVMQTRCDASATAEDVFMQFNADTGANYTREFSFATGSGLTVGNTISSSSAAISGMPCATSLANVASSATVEIPNYSGAVFFKSASAYTGYLNGASASGIAVVTTGFLWANAAAITSLKLIAASGNFVVGSVFGLYGY